MAKGYEVLKMLLPNGGWVQTGDTYEGIEFIEATPITKKQYEDGFSQFDKWQAEQNLAKIESKNALLEKLGITKDEAKLLLS